MTERINTNICVIGAGAGGLAVAAGAAAFGVPVVLVAKGPLGADGLKGGSAPSAALIAAARRAHRVGGAAAFGVIAPRDTWIDLQRVQGHVRA